MVPEINVYDLSAPETNIYELSAPGKSIYELSATDQELAGFAGFFNSYMTS